MKPSTGNPVTKMGSCSLVDTNIVVKTLFHVVSLNSLFVFWFLKFKFTQMYRPQNDIFLYFWLWALTQFCFLHYQLSMFKDLIFRPDDTNLKYTIRLAQEFTQQRTDLLYYPYTSDGPQVNKFYQSWGRILRIWAAAKIWGASQTWLVSLDIVFNVLRFEPALNWNRFLAVQRCGLNSLNSASGNFWIGYP